MAGIESFRPLFSAAFNNVNQPMGGDKFVDSALVGKSEPCVVTVPLTAGEWQALMTAYRALSNDDRIKAEAFIADATNNSDFARLLVADFSAGRTLAQRSDINGAVLVSDTLHAFLRHIHAIGTPGQPQGTMPSEADWNAMMRDRARMTKEDIAIFMSTCNGNPQAEAVGKLLLELLEKRAPYKKSIAEIQKAAGL